ncbi:MAG: ATPase [Betaproteobacteria bacterium]|nr:ATPase [Betaproteobacteria bacterium]
MKDSGENHGHPYRRLDRRIEEVVHDPYAERSKPREPAACPDCGAVFTHGRWAWSGPADGAGEHLCPACHRIRDRMPAGWVTLAGSFLPAHREEILHLVHNEADRVRAEHPLERIMDVADSDGTTTITTTGIHLARRLGDAIHHAYQGALDTQYAPDEYRIRVHWSR